MGTVKEKYGFVPTSVLHFGKTKSLTRGYLGTQQWRKDNTDNSSSSSMSEFNPDLCKFIIQYWSDKHDFIVDPYHGWGTRGAISAQLGRNYVGFDISKKTNADVKAMFAEQKKQTQWFDNQGGKAEFICGDGIEINGIKEDSVDLVFSCPPYFNIEKYESTGRQLSDMDDYGEFMKIMEYAAKRQYEVLKNNKYCVMVVGDWRVEGELLMFSKDMINAYIKAGFIMHDYIIHKLNSMAVVGCGNFEKQRHVTKSHEYVLVFKKVIGRETCNLTQKQNIKIKEKTLNNLEELRNEFPHIPDESLQKIMEQRRL